jgi:hypothetical protein
MKINTLFFVASVLAALFCTVQAKTGAESSFEINEKDFSEETDFGELQKGAEDSFSEESNEPARKVDHNTRVNAQGFIEDNGSGDLEK